MTGTRRVATRVHYSHHGAVACGDSRAVKTTLRAEVATCAGCRRTIARLQREGLL